MATVELTSENLKDLVENSATLFIDFWASWCGPCRMFGPVFESAAEKNPDAVFAKCDTEAQEEVAAAFGIRSIPTLAVFRDGVLIFQQPGALPAAAFDELIEKVKEVDMDEVRKEMAKEQAKQAEDASSADD
ncbi:MAG: thioredoxin [Proteobacteria bacterium]|nr:thioredoxin [Pseudomonadota bacterium]